MHFRETTNFNEKPKLVGRMASMGQSILHGASNSIIAPAAPGNTPYVKKGVLKKKLSSYESAATNDS